MPELPEVETIKRQLAKKILGKELEGREVAAVARRGKILIIEFKDKARLIFHLKLTGQLLLNAMPSRFTRKVFKFNDGTTLVFNDMIKFGWWRHIKNKQEIKEMKALGPEPLTLSEKEFKTRLFKRAKSRIKPLLMDQKFIAGIGNIYADEILFDAGIHPQRKAGSLSESEVEAIIQSTKKILTAAIKMGGSSVRHYVDVEGKKGNYKKQHKVYHKTGQPCKKCGTPIKQIKLGGRSAHFCPKCQR